jgi:predicted ABC-type transport system involved in lysophospholipase L1 biosynthesis ATPase subunit
VSETPFALVMVTHSQEAAALCDRVLTLDHGRLSHFTPLVHCAGAGDLVQ